jgi:hypothetical protein
VCSGLSIAALEQGNQGPQGRGVKKAPFVVLVGAHMPSILAEISLLTNPDDAHELGQPAYRQSIADSLYQGVAECVNGLSGVRLAENREHAGANLARFPVTLVFDARSEPRMSSASRLDKENWRGAWIGRRRRQNILDCEVTINLERHASHT